MSHFGTLDVSVGSMLQQRQRLRFLRECRLPAHLMFQYGQCLGTVKVYGSSGNVACQHTWCFSEVNVLAQSRFEIPQGMSLAGTLYISVRSMLRHIQSLRFLKECRSPAHLMFQRGQYFDTFKFRGFSGNVARRHTWSFSEVNTSAQSKFEVAQGMPLAGTLDGSTRSMLWHSQSWGSTEKFIHWHVWCFSKVNASTQSRFEIPQGMSLSGTLNVSETSMLRHSQGLRFFRKCRSPAHLMFQLGQCFDTDKDWGSSEIVARRNTWCFTGVNSSTQWKFEVPQGMLLASTLDVSARSMFSHSQSWGSSENVARQHTWCFSEVNAFIQSKFKAPQGMSLAGTLDVSVRSMLWYSQSLRFLRECPLPAHMMFQIGQCFDQVKVWGLQGMSLTGTLDVSVRSMLRKSQGLRFLRKYRLSAHLVFQRDQCFDTVKFWGSSGNVARGHTWCFSVVNALT